jgi:hypothetical protein
MTKVKSPKKLFGLNQKVGEIVTVEGWDGRVCISGILNKEKEGCYSVKGCEINLWCNLPTGEWILDATQISFHKNNQNFIVYKGW